MSKNLIQIDLGEIQNTCFVVMPFAPLFQTQYSDVIQEALKDLDITCVRGDEIYSRQRIMDDIWCHIKRCRLVIAELTGRNPNVLYEIGLAHALGKPIIILTRNAEDVPFDLKDLRYLYYDTNDPFWGNNLKKGIKNMVEKVLESPGIEVYLEGISFPQKINYPKIDKIKKAIKSPKVILPNVSGTWIGNHSDFSERINSITLTITQDGKDLYATSINSYPTKNKQTVVQQIMNGKLSGNIIKLIGVNYTYVERGDESEDYILDEYKLTFDKKREMLVGNIVDKEGFADEFELKKYKGN